MTSYRIGILTKDDPEPVFNGLRFSTRAVAEEVARDLYSRWTAVESYVIVESDEAPNEPQEG